MSAPRKRRKPRHRDTLVTIRSGTSRAVGHEIPLNVARRLMDKYPDTWGKGSIEREKP